MQSPRAHVENDSGSTADSSDLDDNTDTLGRAIRRHERDARRVRGVLDSSKAYEEDKMSRLYTQGPVRPAAQQYELDTGERTPDYNIPRHWGHRTRPEDNWIRESRIPVSAERQERISRAKVDKDAIIPHRTSYTGDDYWEDGARLLGDDTPPSMKRRRPLVQPTSLRHMNPRLRDIVQSKGDVSQEQPEPTARVQASTRRLDLDARARREQLHARLERYRAAASRNRDAVAADTGSDKENNPSQAAKSPQALSEQLEEPKAHNRSQSIQMLQRLAKVTQSPPRAQRENTQSLDAATPLVTGGWIDTPQAKKTQDVPEIRVEQPPDAVPTGGQMNKITRLPLTEIVDAKQQIGAAVAAVAAPVVEASRSFVRAVTTSEQPPKQEAPSTSDSNALDQYITGLFKEHARSPAKPVVVADNAEDVSTVDKHTGAHPETTATTMVIQNRVNGFAGKTICTHCGGSYTSIWKGLWYELQGCFYTFDKGGLHLTTLGALTAMFLCWLLLEIPLCYGYCHPRYSTRMIGYGVDYHAPIFPFAVPTLLLRPFAFLWRPFTKQALRAKESLLKSDQKASLALPSRLPRSTPTRSAYRSIVQPSRWLSAATSTAVATVRRALDSAGDAVEEMGRIW